ncbi:YppG family protein [Aquibacillus kalidii]|uniref:YppG family protein n=1 Tax=Aquibacillus kalidii TaxID=2762597 RepID=UPI001648F7C7|nr:YppG family protein [Aquibacillus kalidii]
MEQPNKKNDYNHPFDQMMFGGRRNQPKRYDSNKEQKSAEHTKSDEATEDGSVDLFSTAQTVVETYQQLSPYVKGISGMFKRFKSK